MFMGLYRGATDLTRAGDLGLATHTVPIYFLPAKVKKVSSLSWLLTFFDGGRQEDRTLDLLIANQALSHLR